MKRYESYKDSGVEWIGEIPSHWRTFPTHQVLVETKEKYSTTTEHLPLLSVSGIEGVYQREYEHDGQVRTDDELESYNILRRGQLVMNPLVNPLRLDYFAMCLSSLDGVVSPVYMVFETSHNSRFIEWFYKSHLVIQDLIRNTKGIRPLSLQLSRETLKEVDVLLPPLPEQEQIVSFLDEKTSKIDDLIKKKEQKIELLKEYRTSLINRVITKGLNPDVPMKDSGVEWISEIPSHWEVKRLKHISSMFGRIGFRGYTTDDIVDEGQGCITISPGNIKDDVFTLEKTTYLSWDKYYESPEIMIFKDDIILVKTGSTIGKTSIIPSVKLEMTINPQLVVLKDVTTQPRYLYYLTTCQYFKSYFEVEQTGGTTPTISQEKIGVFPTIVPPVPEQEQIVSYLDGKTGEIDSTIDSEKKKIDLLKEYRQSLISSVITGKIKVVD
jgi:type I restriction enzyme S subunit